MDLGHGGRAPADDRRRPGPDRGRVVRRGPRPRVPAPRRADADPDPRRRRGRRATRSGTTTSSATSSSAHDPALLEKPILVAFNKMDLPAAREAWPAFRASLQAAGIDAVAISADSGRGAGRAAGRRVRAAARRRGARRAAGARRASSSTGSRPRATGSRSSTRTTAYRVSGKRIERLVAQTNFENEESAERFQRELVRTGIDGALRKAGIRPGRHGPHRRHGAGVGPARGRPLTEPADAVAPPAAVVPGLARRSSAGRSTRSTTATSRSPRRPARRWASSACVLRAGGRAAPQARPSRSPPAEHRLAMVEAAVAGNPAFGRERDRARARRASYTVDTLEALSRPRGCAASVVHPLGRGPGRASRRGRSRTGSSSSPASPSCRGAASRRSTTRWVAAHFPGREDRVRFLPGPLLPISGSVIRRRVAAGRSIRYLVPDAVARYIADHRLYLEPA